MNKIMTDDDFENAIMAVLDQSELAAKFGNNAHARDLRHLAERLRRLHITTKEA